MTQYEIKPNKRTRVQDFEISCYGEGLIMVDHPQLPAPKPLAPEDDGDFWEHSDDERVLKIMDHLDGSIDWLESSPDIMLWLGDDIDQVRDRIE